MEPKSLFPCTKARRWSPTLNQLNPVRFTPTLSTLILSSLGLQSGLRPLHFSLKSYGRRRVTCIRISCTISWSLKKKKRNLAVTLARGSFLLVLFLPLRGGGLESGEVNKNNTICFFGEVLNDVSCTCTLRHAFVKPGIRHGPEFQSAALTFLLCFLIHPFISPHIFLWIRHFLARVL
jgi:hypothetical protein